MKIPYYIFCSYTEKGFGWFRVFGIGLHWKDITKHKLLFSERNNIHSNHIMIGKWRFAYLEYCNLSKNLTKDTKIK
jgi:hypothetical protein